MRLDILKLKRARLKKLLCIILVFSMILSAPVASFAAEAVNDALDSLADALSGVFGSIFKQKLTASDGNEYLVTVTYGNTYAIPSDAELYVSEIKEGDEGYAEYVAMTAEKLEVSPDQFAFARPFDISLRSSQTGEEYQPDGDVKVSIRLLKEDLNEYENIDVVHFHGEAGDAEVMDTNIKGTAVEFETDGFSVYVVVGHEGDTKIVTPRVEFHFIDEEYTEIIETDPVTNTTTLKYQAAPFRFVNKGGTMQTTQILKDGEALEMIANPPNRIVPDLDTPDPDDTKQMYFFGWYLVGGGIDSDTGDIVYTWTADPEKVSVEKTMTLKDADGHAFTGETVLNVGDTVTWEIDGVSGTAQLDEEATAHVFLAPVYEDYYFVSYRLGPHGSSLANSLYRRELVVLGTDNQVTVRIGRVVCPSPDAKHQVFNGWEIHNVQIYYTADPSTGAELPSAGSTDGGYYVTFNKTQFNVTDHTLDLYPVFAEARWMYFNTGKTGNGASYVPSAFRLTNDANSGTYFDNTFFVGDTGAGVMNHLSTRPGFDLEGWYLNAATDDDTGNITNLPGAAAQSVTLYILDDRAKAAHEASGSEPATPASTVTGVSVISGSETVAATTAAVNQDGEIEITVNLNAIKLFDTATGAIALPGGYQQKVTYTLDGETHTVTLFEVKNEGGSNHLYLYKALDDMTVTANWTAQTVDYTVVYWLENANDSNYTLMYYKTLQGVAGAQTAATGVQASDTFVLNGTTYHPYEEYPLKFAHLSTDQNKTEAGNQTGIQQQTIAGDNSTIVNVYYDRDVYTLRFDIGFARRTSTSGSTPIWQPISGADAASYAGTVYGVVDGTTIALTSDGNGGWTYAGTVDVRHDYDGYRYQSTTGSTGTQYGVAGGEVVELSGSISYTRATGFRYQVSTNDNDNNPEKYGIFNGGINRVYWRNGAFRQANWDNATQYTGTVFTRSNAQNVGSAYGGDTLYYLGDGVFVENGSGQAYGYDNTYYFPLDVQNSLTYNGGTSYGNGPRYLRVANDDADASYTLGFVNGTMQTVLHDAQGWYYNTQEPSTVKYTGTLYVPGSLSGTWQFSVSNITAPNYANNDNWDSWLTEKRCDLGTTNPFGASEYTGTYQITVSGTPYTVFYYDIVGKYGENILSRYPGSQPARKNGNTTYNFVGWLAQRDSYYNGRLSTSIKGFFETISEDLILTGGPIPGNNATIQNINPDNYHALTVEEYNTYLQNLGIPEHQGITQEFRCRYRSGDGCNYLYRIYLADNETLAYPSEPSYKYIITAGSGSYPNLQTPPTYTGYTLESAVVLDSSGAEQTPGGNGTYSAYAVPELTAAGVGNGMIMVFRLQPNLHHISYKYGARSPADKIGETFATDSLPYYYGQSIANANVNQAEAEAAIPEGHRFAGWYENPDGVGNKFSFSGTMPDGDIVLYAVYTPIRFRVEIDPNGAEIDHVNHNFDNASDDLKKKGYTNYWWNGARWANENNSAPASDDLPGVVTYSEGADTTDWVPFATFNRGALYKKDANGDFILDNTNQKILERAADKGYKEPDYSTYFNANYHETVGEYTLTRDFVPISDAAAAAYEAEGGYIYYYINTQTKPTDGSSIPSDLRNALYVTEDELHQYYLFYRDWIQGNLDGGYISGTTLLDEETWRYTYVGTQKYRKCFDNEHYVFLGWYRVYRDEDGNETSVDSMPFDFTTPVSEAMLLRAYWRLDGGYSILYMPEFTMEDGTIINGELQQWRDPMSDSHTYADQAETEVLQQPTGLTANGEPTEEYIFRGWRVVSMGGTPDDPEFTELESNVFYQPGDPFTIHADLADKNGIIRMQAFYEEKDSSYRRPHITNLTLDANTGYLTQDGTTEATENFDLTSTWNSTVVRTVGADAENDRIEFGDIQSSEPVHLYRYATDIQYPGGVTVYQVDTNGDPVLDGEGNPVEDTSKKLTPAGKNYFAHKDGHFLLGFDDQPAEGDYIATYAADGIIAVTRNDARTIYAVWEPMVYLTVKNETGVGPVSFTLSSPDSETLQIINTATGMYERIPLADLEAITVEDGKSVRLAIPKGSEKNIVISGTNRLGIGWMLSAESVLGSDTANPQTVRASFADVKNTKNFSLTDRLVTDEIGLIVTFTAKKNPHTLALYDNYSTRDPQEVYFSETNETPVTVYYETATQTYYDLPSTTTRIGYEFVGWDPDPNWATTHNVNTEHPAYYVDDWRIDNLNEFFSSTGDPAAPDLDEVDLYAVWKINIDAQTVYVFKEVPEPGSVDKEFTFTVSLSGTYNYKPTRRDNYNNLIEGTVIHGTIPESGTLSRTFTLKHGEYLRIFSAKDVGTDTIQSFMQSEIKKFDKDGNLVSTDTLRWEWPDWKGTVTQSGQVYQRGNSILFDSQLISVTEADYSADHYDTTAAVSGSATGYDLIVDTANPRRLYWTDTDAGGTAIFTNTRQTVDVTVKKILESNTSVATQFKFTAHYSVTDNINGTNVTTTKDFGSFNVTSGSAEGYKLEGIPVGAQLYVSETGTDLCDYDTYFTNSVTSSAVFTPVTELSSTTSGSVTTYSRGICYSVVANLDAEITFKNVLKYYKVTFYKVDQNKQAGVPSYFKLTGPYGLLGQQLYPLQTGSGQFYTNDKLYAGEYTLEETFTSENYMGLAGPVTLKVTGADLSATEPRHISATTAAGDEAKVVITGDATSGYDVYVYNIRTVKVNISKVMSDPLLSTNRVFFFDVFYSYTLNQKTVQVNHQGNADPTSETGANGVLIVREPAVEVESGHSATVKIPVGATGIGGTGGPQFAEDTLRLANSTDTIAQTYDTTRKYNDQAAVSSSSYSYPSALADSNDGDTVTFTNTRKTVDVAISKTVIGANTTDDFIFEVKVLNGALPIKNYTVYDGGTPAAPSDDWVTDDTGLVTLPGGAPFSLTNGGAKKTVKIPVGATITVEEKLTTAQEAKGYAVFMTMPGRKVDLVDGRADKVRLIGPTENQEIHVYNIPSICKVTDADGNLLYVLQEGASTPDDPSDDIYIPAIFPTIKGAFEGRDDDGTGHKIGGLGNYYPKDSNTLYPAESQHQVQMLVDYQVPETDVVEVDPGFDMVFTTASTTATDGYPFRRSGAYSGTLPSGVDPSESVGKAVLTRPTDAEAAFFTVNKEKNSTKTIFKMSDLILDGSGATLTAAGGALTAYNTAATIEDCVIFRFEAQDGGAVNTTGDSLTVTRTVFDNCKSDKTGDGFGGGGINTQAGTLTITYSKFQYCIGVHQAGAVYHVGKGKTMTVSNCDFIECSARSGGGVQADVTTVTITDCNFIRCDANATDSGNGGNGGGLNNFVTTIGDAGSTLVVTNCTFQGCKAVSSPGGRGDCLGGGMRSTARTATITGCTFEDDVTDPANPVHCSSSKNGGGAAFTNANATATLNGCTFENCTAASGGGIYSAAKSLTLQNDAGNQTLISACTATNGGGAYFKGGFTINDSTSFQSCYAATGGAIFATGTSAVGTVNDTVTISKNYATASKDGGGAIRVTEGAGVTINGGTISENYVTQSGNNSCGGAITVYKGSLNITGGLITGNYVTTNSSGKEVWGGAIYVSGTNTISGTLSVSGGEISGNYAEATTNTAYGGGIVLNGAYATGTISNGTISGNHAYATQREAIGGGILVNDGARLTVTGGTISDNYAKCDIKNINSKDRYATGGAIAVRSASTLTLSGGTISENTVENTKDAAYVKGAGIYLDEGTTLNISGDPSFGGADTANADETYSFTEGQGNLLTTTLSGAKNGGQTYNKARQDIYLAGYSGVTATSINVTGEITSGVGAIWIWAEAGTATHADGDHIHKDDQFALMTVPSSISDSSLHVFRNARIDADSGASSTAYYGVRSSKTGEDNYVIWGSFGGAQVFFRKIDGFGEGLGGATFTLYYSLEKARSKSTAPEDIVAIRDELHSGGANTASSATTAKTGVAVGDVKFTAPMGIYYMRESVVPGSFEANDKIYVVLVGGGNVTVPATRSGEWAGVLSEIDQTMINSQRGTLTAGRYEWDSAVFLIDGDSTSTTYGKAVTTPDIAKYGLMNISTLERPVILSKINPSFDPLSGGKFTIYRYDRTIVEADLASDDTGIYYVGRLPYGTYLVDETQTPTGYQQPGTKECYVFSVDENGVHNKGKTGTVTNTLKLISDGKDYIYPAP